MNALEFESSSLITLSGSYALPTGMMKESESPQEAVARFNWKYTFQEVRMAIQTSVPIPESMTKFRSLFCSGHENSLMKAYLKNQRTFTSHRKGRNRNPTE